jgi:hypothetical protein
VIRKLTRKPMRVFQRKPFRPPDLDACYKRLRSGDRCFGDLWALVQAATVSEAQAAIPGRRDRAERAAVYLSALAEVPSLSR